MIYIVLFLICLSYFIGIRSILVGKYKPSIYSRIIWFLLTLNSYASIIALKNSRLIIAYGSLALIGNFVILFLSIKKSERIFGPTELVSSSLLVISLLIWIFTRLPLLNLTIGLIAHFIGGVPTIKRVAKDPKTEDIQFWLYFCVASILTTIDTPKTGLKSYLYPLYFALFDGLMAVLCARKYLSSSKNTPAKR